MCTTIKIIRCYNSSKYMHFFSTGKPVAVTSNRGAGKAPLRPGANPQLEWQYYQNKLLNGKAGTDKSICLNCFVIEDFFLKVINKCRVDKLFSYVEFQLKKCLWTT